MLFTSPVRHFNGMVFKPLDFNYLKRKEKREVLKNHVVPTHIFGSLKEFVFIRSNLTGNKTLAAEQKEV